MEDMTCQIEKVGFRRFVEKFESKRFLKKGTGKCVPKIFSSTTPHSFISKITTEMETSPSKKIENPGSSLLTDAQVISADPGNNSKVVNQFG